MHSLKKYSLWLCFFCGFTATAYADKAETFMSNQRVTALSLSLSPAQNAIFQEAAEHQLIAIGDAHFHNEVMEFVTSLVTSADFNEQIQHVIVEFGNSRHQALLNDYLNGEAISDHEVKKVWQDALYFTAWTPSVYSDFFKQLRAFNKQQPIANRIRVTLAEKAFHWDALQSGVDWQKLAHNKVAGYLDAIRLNLKQEEKALLVFGAFHTISLHDNGTNSVAVERLPLVTQLEREGYDVYSIWPVIQPKLIEGLVKAQSIQPGLLTLPNSVLDQIPFVELFPKAKKALAGMQALDASAKDLFDAMLYLGNIQADYKLAPVLLNDRDFIEKATQRVDMIGGRVKAKFHELITQSNH